MKLFKRNWNPYKLTNATRYFYLKVIGIIILVLAIARGVVYLLTKYPNSF